MRRIVVCGLSGSTIFFSCYLINGKNFGKELLNSYQQGPFSHQFLHHDFLLNTGPTFLALTTLFLNNFTWYFLTSTLRMAGAGRNM
jgi:hypothetical protein